MLGNDYRITASMGHVRDLPEHSFGVDIEHGFTPQYTENSRSGKIIKELKSLAKNASEIYLAPDPDREGEAIAWHLKELLQKGSKADFHRVTFHEITRSAIDKAFQATSEIDMNLVDAQQARRVLDRMVGYMISPLLWSRIEKGISAGRVQSVALRIICEREREIIAFEPKEYWNFLVDFDATSPESGKTFPSKLVKINSEKIDIGNEEDATKVVQAVRGASSFAVSKIETKPRNRYAPPPFITSTLQQTASSYLNFSASFTMQIAQQLYEGIEMASSGSTGLITYMRTDSVNIANEARESCRNYIKDNIGPDYLPEKPNFFKSKSSAQEAHEAIRPTDVNLTPEKIASYLSPQQLKLYTLIWKRFVSCQMAPALQMQTNVEVSAKGSDNRDYLFRTVATVTTFQGFLKVYQDQSKKEDENKLPAFLAELKTGETCFLKNLNSEQKFTEPPPRYSEATLIRELESNGIGRPSTYASIINTILRRNYVTREKGRLHPSDLGFKVNDFLVNSLPELFQIGFTADMENRLDNIEEGNVEWTKMLKEFYDDFALWVEDAKHIGSPEEKKPKALISLLETVQNWAPPEKRGRRTYNDEKFFNSVKEKFEEGSKITANQWSALLNIATKYSDQLPQLDATASEFGFDDELNATREKIKEAEARRKNTAASNEDMEKYNKIFSFFNEVKWNEAETRRGRSYDDAKFFDSLKKQAESGKILSEKQMGVVARFASKYKEQIQEFENLAKLLDIDPNGEEAGGESAPPSEEVQKLLDTLSKIEKWGEPVKKGRRVYDDKAFYESLDKQVKSGKKLSDRQVAAMKKLCAKYTKEQ
jgi:DNA topoisomerase-1